MALVAVVALEMMRVVAAAVAVQVMAPALMVSAVQADLELLSSNTQTHLPSSMLTED